MSKTGPKPNNIVRNVLHIVIVVICTGFGIGQAPAGYWSDPATGLAIGGFDPLAYFTSGEERIGVGAYEVAWRGQVWRFANAGNKAAFIDAPEHYAPQFGGYGLVSVSRGLPAVGNPRIWVIYKDRLYFFHSHSLRVVWEKNSAQIIGEARENWPRVELATEE